jgi:uncharacterized membrane protein YdjX (TVP38/TMEM64 family)
VGLVLVLLAVAGTVWAFLDLATLERTLGELGPWGPVAFLVVFVVVTPVLVPDTPLTIAAGALFGLVWGTILTSIGAFVTAAIIYLVSRWLLHDWLQQVLARQPRLRAVESVVARGQKRLLILLRLIPINPALVNYLLAATSISFGRYMLSCLGLVPTYFATVYVGWMARIATTGVHEASWSDYLAGGGFVVTIVVLVMATRAARRAIREAEGGSVRSLNE